MAGFTQAPFTHVECGIEFTIALRADSTIWICGDNTSMQYGNYLVSPKDTLFQIQATEKWTSVAAGGLHVLAISADSTLWGWGENANGELGLGYTDEVDTTAQINVTNHWRSISANISKSMAIRNDGTLWAAGYNYFGMLGTGDSMDRYLFTQIGASNDWKVVYAGGLFTLAIKQDGTLWGWGYNGDGELGMDNTTGIYFSPTQIGMENNWVSVSGGFRFALAMKADGTIWATGSNTNGQLGRPASVLLDSTFKQIGSDNDWKFIGAGALHSFAVRNNGTLWGWGDNEYGQLGSGIADTAASVMQIGTDTNWQYITGADGALSPSTFAVIGYHSAGLKTNAEGICTAGADYYGQLGTDTIIGLPNAQFYFDCSVGDNALAVAYVMKNAAVNVYPNPASGLLHIDGITNTAQYKVVNMMGTVAQTGTLQNGDNTLSIKHLVPGSYIVTVITEEGKIYNTHLVKE